MLLLNIFANIIAATSQMQVNFIKKFVKKYLFQHFNIFPQKRQQYIYIYIYIYITFLKKKQFANKLSKMVP